MKRARILVVEDERITARDIQATLQSLGHEVPAISASGDDALAKVEALRPDLVLLDIRLQGSMDGVTVAEEIRRRHRIPVIYLTANADPATVERATRTEAYGYLLKPFSEQELHTTVQLALYKAEAERALSEREAWFRKLVEKCSDITLVLDAEASVRFASPPVERVLGHRPEDLLGRNAMELIHPDDRARMEEAFSYVLTRAEECVSMECRSHHPSGAWRVLEAQATNYLADPVIQGVVVNTRDITEGKEAGAALAEEARTSARFAAALENLTTGVLITDPAQPDNPVIYANRGFMAVTGYAEQEVVGRNARLLQGPETDAHAVREIGKAIDERRPFHGRVLNYRKDGTRFWNEMTISPVYDAAGELINFVGLQSDITQMVEAEERLLEQVREKTALLAEVHHRVKNNLQIISSLLNMQIRSMHDPVVVEALRESQNRTRAIALVHETLYRSGNYARVDLSDYLRHLLQHVQRSLGIGTGVQIKRELEPVSVPLNQAVPCGLILNELITNALKHAFAEGGEGEVRVALSQVSDEQCTLVVHDNGASLPEVVDLENPRSVGLQLVRMLSEQIGAKVELRRGPGTEFRITFPIAAEQSP